MSARRNFAAAGRTSSFQPMIDLAKVTPELFMPALRSNLRQVGPERKLCSHFLDAVLLRLGADCAWLRRVPYGERLLPEKVVAGDPRLYDEQLVAAFVRRERPPIPAGAALAVVALRGRQVAVVGVSCRDRSCLPPARRTLERLCRVLAGELGRREEDRLARVLDRIREKIVSELRPRDLAYQILDGLHQLVDYDHSSAFLAYDREAGVFRIEAEKIVWTKAKSSFVGHEIRMSAEQVTALSRAITVRTLPGLSAGAAGLAAEAQLGAAGPPPPAAGLSAAGEAGGRDGGGGGDHRSAGADGGGGTADGPDRADRGHRADRVESVESVDRDGGGGGGSHLLLDYHRGQRGAGVPPVASLLVAPLFFDGEFLGLLKMAAWKRPPFGRYEIEVVQRFLPAAAVSMRNAQVNKTLERQAMQAEMKAGLVTLAHAVAHDVNNAVGSILPLAQQMRLELRQPPVDLETFDRDLGVIIDNARLCQRIFSNMLRVAGSGRSGDGPVDASQVVAETLPFLNALAARRGVEIALDLAPDLPPIRFSRHDLQHIVLNLVRNALEAVAPDGGRVAIATRRGGRCGAELSVLDDGPGITAALLPKVQEPFFSTKPRGTGLGLAICRALVWQNGGSMEIQSPPAPGAAGTRVLVELGPESAPAGECG
ncbi:MAG TPA: ATP-binding protein [Thermoanaerobaculia bacterium]|nr:ATP-binding protein [Thermoanaerobaculia bacterium]